MEERYCECERVGDQIIVLKFVVEHDTFNVNSTYVPQIGLAEHLKIKIWEDLEDLLQVIP